MATMGIWRTHDARCVLGIVLDEDGGREMKAIKGIRVFYCAVWLGGIGYMGNVAYDVIMPVAHTLSATLHNALLDNRGVHD
ncbi:hypothetical protein [Burkholderia pseudomallei]|uniref:hypothetical protein n=1 Tax=Burkholderia pseudomallei TaxID=28450 RepID=UPI001605D67D|nr:hypothetical protein [Burkholderia pseudomallei]